MIAFGVVAKGNGDAFLMREKHTALSVGGGEPGQGYPAVLEVQDEREDIHGSAVLQVDGIGQIRELTE